MYNGIFAVIIVKNIKNSLNQICETNENILIFKFYLGACKEYIIHFIFDFKSVSFFLQKK